MSKRSKAGEDCGVWHRRLRAWRGVHEDVLTDPEMPRIDLRDAISCKLPFVVPGATDRKSAAEQVNVYLMKSAHDSYLSECHDDDPDIRVRRTGGGREAEFAAITETIVQRVLDESGANREYRSVTTDCMWYGIGFVWYRIDVLPTAEKVREGRKGAGDLTEEVLQGRHVPHASHAHGVAADAFETVANSPTTGLALPVPQSDALFDAAGAHRAMEVDEDEEPQPIWTPEKGSIVAEWTPPGWTAWSPEVTDVSRAWWIARGFVMKLEDAKNEPTFKPSVRKKLVGQAMSRTDVAQTYLEQNAIDVDSMRAQDFEGTFVFLWEVWDRKNRARHYISEQLDEFLERDETYPYLDDKGNIGIPGFYPCSWTYHVLPPRYSSKRAWAVPVLAPGWPQQLEIVKFRSAMLTAAKRTNRFFVYAKSGLDQRQIEAMMAGKDMQGVGADLSDLKQAIHFPPIPNVPGDWVNETSMLMDDFQRAVGRHPAAISGLTGEKTATGALVQQQAQQGLTGDFLRSVEAGIARGCTIVRALVKIGYPPEKIAELLDQEYLDPQEPSEDNPEGLSLFEQWRERSDRGDRFLPRVHGRRATEDPVRLGQLMQLIQLADIDIDPVLGVPNIDKAYLVDAAFRSAGEGEPVRFSESEKLDMIAKRMTLGTGAPMGAPGGEGGGESAGKPSGPPPSPPKAGGRPTPSSLPGMAAAAARP